MATLRGKFNDIAKLNLTNTIVVLQDVAASCFRQNLSPCIAVAKKQPTSPLKWIIRPMLPLATHLHDLIALPQNAGSYAD